MWWSRSSKRVIAVAFSWRRARSAGAEFDVAFGNGGGYGAGERCRSCDALRVGRRGRRGEPRGFAAPM